MCIFFDERANLPGWTEILLRVSNIIARSLTIAHLALKQSEFSLITPGCFYPHGIN
jgi:hypothetical protein